jgi:hypothetical protein
MLPRFEKKLRVALGWTLDLFFPRDFVQLLTVHGSGQMHRGLAHLRGHPLNASPLKPAARAHWSSRVLLENLAIANEGRTTALNKRHRHRNREEAGGETTPSGPGWKPTKPRPIGSWRRNWRACAGRLMTWPRSGEQFEEASFGRPVASEDDALSKAGRGSCAAQKAQGRANQSGQIHEPFWRRRFTTPIRFPMGLENQRAYLRFNTAHGDPAQARTAVESPGFFLRAWLGACAFLVAIHERLA